jgi:diguanylate cyclase
LLGTSLSCGFAVLVNYLLLFSGSLTPSGRSLITTIAVPVVVGTPLSFLLAYALRTARRYRRALNRAASYDSSTDVLNDGAFTSIVERRTSVSRSGPQQGAFLIVDANTLRSVSMRHGREWGEDALRLIAVTIRSALRSEDLVGRLGPSQFGIFLPGASEQDAQGIGQRILAGVRQVYRIPAAGSDDLLEVRVAGVCFDSPLPFGGMYRAAEQQSSSTMERDQIPIAHVTEPIKPDQPRPARSLIRRGIPRAAGSRSIADRVLHSTGVRRHDTKCRCASLSVKV